MNQTKLKQQFNVLHTYYLLMYILLLSFEFLSSRYPHPKVTWPKSTGWRSKHIISSTDFPFLYLDFLSVFGTKLGGAYEANWKWRYSLINEKILELHFHPIRREMKISNRWGQIKKWKLKIYISKDEIHCKNLWTSFSPMR